jgi:hypothetical protein
LVGGAVFSNYKKLPILVGTIFWHSQRYSGIPKKNFWLSSEELLEAPPCNINFAIKLFSISPNVYGYEKLLRSGSGIIILLPPE